MILITGASGLVGSHLLLKQLEKSQKIRAIIRSKEAKKKIAEVFSYYDTVFSKIESNIEWCYGDITDELFMSGVFEGVKKVYHCAAYVSFNEKDKKKIYRTNIKGTSVVVNLCLSHGVEKLVHVSSIAAIKVSDDLKETTEDMGWPSGKQSTYAYSKTQSEFEVWRGVEEGLKAVVVNPSVILGPGNWSAGSGRIFSRVFSGMQYFTRGVTGFVDVRDVVKAMIMLMESEIHAKRYILNGENLSYEDLFKNIAKHLKVNPPWKYASPRLTSIAWRLAKLGSLFTFSTPQLTRNTSAASHRIQKYTSNRIKEDLKLDFYPIQDTIRFSCQKFLQSKPNSSS